MFRIILICIIVSFTRAQSVGIEGKNPSPEIYYNGKPCDFYTDCYNCTIAKCRWEKTG